MLKKTSFKIGGIHCQSCKTLIETEVDVLPGVKSVDVDYINGDCEIEFDDEKTTKEEIFSEIKKLNYQPEEFGETTKTKDKKEIRLSPFTKGMMIPIVIGVMIGFYFLVKHFGGFEILAKLNEGNVSYGLILFIGLLAGFHCVGMCGGLVIAYSANHLRKEARGEKKSHWPHLQYNFGRVISYSVLGALLGGAGSFFGINPLFTGTITLLAGIFMVIMGVSFVKNWPILEKLKIRTPQFIARYLYNQKHSRKPKGPFMVGLLNGFMPCGPLQAMELYALASGSVTRGALSMAVYALGTSVLMFGFGSALSAIGKKHIKTMITVSGVLVLVLGLFMVNRGLTSFGYGFGHMGLGNNIAQEKTNKNSDEGYQIIKMDLTYYGYQPNTLYIKKGVPVKWVINVKEMTGCTDAIMIESLGIKKDLQYGENIIKFTPPKDVKEIKFSCWMRMVWGKFVVTDGDSSLLKVEEAQASTEIDVAPVGSGSCGVEGGCGCGCGGAGTGGEKNNSSGSCH